MTQREQYLMQDLVRRKIAFHDNEDPYSIKLWGLANWGEVSKLVNNGIVITDYKRENKVAWFLPAPVILQTILIPAIAIANFNKVNSTEINDYYNYVDNGIVLNRLPKVTKWSKTNVDLIEKEDGAVRIVLSGVLKKENKTMQLAILTINENTFDCQFISQEAKEDVVIDQMIKTTVSLTRKCIAL